MYFISEMVKCKINILGEKSYLTKKIYSIKNTLWKCDTKKERMGVNYFYTPKCVKMKYMKFIHLI